MEVHARGSSGALEEFRTRLEDGPWPARVDGIFEIPVDLPAEVDGFRIVF